VKKNFLAGGISLAVLIALGGVAMADGSGDPKAVKKENGHYFDAQGNPTYSIQADGTVDWATYSGFRRYHSECHVCHGPEGEGSSYAPALKESLKHLSYSEVFGIVVGGKQEVDTANDKVMPAFGDNKNVMCYLNDIFVYLRARANEAVPRGRPPGREDKTPETAAEETACLTDGKS
jgi:methanol metabolism-related c-type cytochrome